jgi:hypothetical protein
MGFASFIGGILLGILAVLVVIFGFVVLLGFVNFIPTNYDLPLGIVLLIIALLMFAYGWYSYQSGKPKGTINVHNQ